MTSPFYSFIELFEPLSYGDAHENNEYIEKIPSKGVQETENLVLYYLQK